MMNTKLISTGLAAVSLATVSNPALAHGGSDVVGAWSGFIHPFTGLDHLLMMLAVGFIASGMGKNHSRALSSVFLAGLLSGVGLGIAGMAFSFVEQGILLSVVVLGLMLAAAFRFDLKITAVLVGGFALFHGAAMGGESGGAIMGSLLGMVVASLLIQQIGKVLGSVLLASGNSVAMKAVGGVFAALGVVLGLA